MRRTVLALVMALGCAGENAEKNNSTTVEGQGQAVESAHVTAEQNDAIDALFRRKASELQSCWQEEYEKTKNRQLAGTITVGLTVTPSGKPTDVRVLKSSMNNASVEQCVVRDVASWNFPEVSAPCPYMRSVHLGAQF
jgi:TonB family protein